MKKPENILGYFPKGFQLVFRSLLMREPYPGLYPQPGEVVADICAWSGWAAVDGDKRTGNYFVDFSKMVPRSCQRPFSLMMSSISLGVTTKVLTGKCLRLPVTR